MRPLPSPAVASLGDVWLALDADVRRSPRATAHLPAVALAGLCAAIWTAAAWSQPEPLVWGAALAAASLAVFAFLLGEGSGYAARSVRGARHVLAGTVLSTLAVLAGAGFGHHLSAARMAGAGLALSLVAAGFDLTVRESGVRRRPVRLVAVGTGKAAARLGAEFAASRPAGFCLVGFVDTGREAHAARPVLGDLDELERVVRDHRADAVVLASPTGRLDVLERVLAMRRRAPAVLELSEAYERAFGRVPVGEINAAWFLRALALSRRSTLALPKRVIDVVVAVLALGLAAPLMLLVALAIRLDSPGPVLYRQRRVGEGGREFMMLKLRSMYQDAEEATGPRWAAVDDPRVTRVGRVLRRFRLDEFPQFWNVLRGEMTVVGPRPERPELVDELARRVPFYDARHLARPGITGWAQVYAPYGASVEDALRKLSYDLYYLNHCSLCTDFGIMLRTAAVIAGGRGAR